MNLFKCLFHPVKRAVLRVAKVVKLAKKSPVARPGVTKPSDIPREQRPAPPRIATGIGPVEVAPVTSPERPLTPLIVVSPNDPVTPASPNCLTPQRSSRRNSDTSSYRSENGSVSRASQSGSLKDQLRSARREWPEGSHKFFVPKCSQESLITESSVKDIIRKDTTSEEKACKYAADTCQHARQLFAILVFLKKGPWICQLLDEGVSDDDLPLRRADTQGPFALQRGTGAHIETLQKWSDKDLEKFDRIQWWMVAPVFERGEHYELEDNAVTPFVPFEGNEEPKFGGYSEVYARRLHPAHHNFWDRPGSENDEPLVAIKKLYSSDFTEFKKEETILKALSPKKHPHLISLLATFRHKQKYHFMFPCADSNLRKYWEDRPNPSFDNRTVMWSLKQMAGIANALFLIHNFRVTYPLSPSGDNLRLPRDVMLSVRQGEEYFGRHGDIKPENILWFKKILEINDEMGVLQIADFGLGRFHGRDSRSGISPSKVVSSPTYEPPECKLHRPVSRSYDLWSLGCLFLEFITWLLKGSDEINCFANFRGRLSSIGINEDNFFTITNDGSGAEVRKEVIDWVRQLRQDEKCSRLIHDLLDLTMEKLLVIDSKQRISAKCLSKKLGEYLQRAGSDMEYLLAPVPSPAEPETPGP